VKLALCLLSFVLTFADRAQEAKPCLTLKTTADFLALHESGKAPTGATALQFRIEVQ
jgi:hypothetical protein